MYSWFQSWFFIMFGESWWCQLELDHYLIAFMFLLPKLALYSHFPKYYPTPLPLPHYKLVKSFWSACVFCDWVNVISCYRQVTLCCIKYLYSTRCAAKTSLIGKSFVAKFGFNCGSWCWVVLFVSELNFGLNNFGLIVCSRVRSVLFWFPGSLICLVSPSWV